MAKEPHKQISETCLIIDVKFSVRRKVVRFILFYFIFLKRSQHFVTIISHFVFFESKDKMHVWSSQRKESP